MIGRFGAARPCDVHGPHSFSLKFRIEIHLNCILSILPRESHPQNQKPSKAFATASRFSSNSFLGMEIRRGSDSNGLAKIVELRDTGGNRRPLPLRPVQGCDRGMRVRHAPAENRRNQNHGIALDGQRHRFRKTHPQTRQVDRLFYCQSGFALLPVQKIQRCSRIHQNCSQRS